MAGTGSQFGEVRGCVELCQIVLAVAYIGVTVLVDKVKRSVVSGEHFFLGHETLDVVRYVLSIDHFLQLSRDILNTARRKDIDFRDRRIPGDGVGSSGLASLCYHKRECLYDFPGATDWLTGGRYADSRCTPACNSLFTGREVVVEIHGYGIVGMDYPTD